MPYRLEKKNSPITAYFISRNHIVFWILLDGKKAEFFIKAVTILSKCMGENRFIVTISITEFYEA